MHILCLNMFAVVRRSLPTSGRLMYSGHVIVTSGKLPLSPHCSDSRPATMSNSATTSVNFAHVNTKRSEHVILEICPTIQRRVKSRAWVGPGVGQGGVGQGRSSHMTEMFISALASI